MYCTVRWKSKVKNTLPKFWIGQKMVPFQTAGIKGLLNIPGDYEVAAFIPLGYPKKEPRVRQVKVDLEERFHVDVW